MPDPPKPRPMRDMSVKELIAESKRLMKISEQLSKRSRELADRVSELNRKKKP